MPQLGLALSGGGFRATIYHLGIIRFLKDAGVLNDVTHIASVSGGSILAAHLALNWDRYTGDDEKFDEAAAEMIRFVQFDIRNRIVRRLPLQLPLRLLGRLLRRKTIRRDPNIILEGYYRKFLYGDRCLYELPERPRLHILTTNVSTGVLAVFNRDGLYMQQRESAATTGFRFIPGQMVTLPRVVGASSAFPGFFPPVEITAADLGVREGQFPTESFTDGGVFDNLGLRAFSWLKHHKNDIERVLVSDAGKPFQILGDTSLGLIGQSVRASDILWDRVWQLERENFGTQPDFIFLPITHMVPLDADPTAMHPVIQAEVQSIRTDLDRFTPPEINGLAQHGYEVARHLYGPHCPAMPEHVATRPPWIPLPDPEETPEKTPQGTSHVTALSRRLRRSGQRQVWRTLLDWRDWPSYVYLALALFLFVYLPLQTYKLYHRAELHATMIDAIADGDPDIRRVLKLVDERPSVHWQGETISQKPQPAEMDYTNVEVLSHSRIVDLRGWHAEVAGPQEQGPVYVHERVQIRLTEAYTGDRRVVLQYPSRVEEIEFRQPNRHMRGTISKVTTPVAVSGETRTLFEIQYDLSDIPLGERVELEIEMLGRFPITMPRARFVTHIKTDLVSVWLLFPADRPYRSYDLVRYPADKSQTPEIMNSRFTIDHPYGSLIGWSVVNPLIDTVYECRWTME